ncbi:MAG: hypothetical protein KDD64_16220 [Bdellovibrionales bacterium]|nr:hypothetical protein [Bdellovibrionales bacterium]
MKGFFLSFLALLAFCVASRSSAQPLEQISSEAQLALLVDCAGHRASEDVLNWLSSEDYLNLFDALGLCDGVSSSSRMPSQFSQQESQNLVVLFPQERLDSEAIPTTPTNWDDVLGPGEKKYVTIEKTECVWITDSKKSCVRVRAKMKAWRCGENICLGLVWLGKTCWRGWCTIPIHGGNPKVPTDEYPTVVPPRENGWDCQYNQGPQGPIQVCTKEDEVCISEGGHAECVDGEENPISVPSDLPAFLPPSYPF